MNTKQDVADYLARCIEDSGKTQIQIADKAGFSAPNALSMMRTGRMKVPMNRIPALAKAMGTDPRELLNKSLEAYHPELYALLSNLAPSMLVTAKELKMIRGLRKAGGFSSLATGEADHYLGARECCRVTV